MIENNLTPVPRNLPRAVNVKLLLARAAMFWERVWPALWPATGILGVILIVTLLEAWSWLPTWLHILTLALFAAVLVFALWRNLAPLTLPTRDEAMRRLETKSGMQHRPISSYEDDLPPPQNRKSVDTATQSLWATHRQRLMDAIRNVRVGRPRSDLPERDPNALRFLVGLIFLLVLIANWPDLSRKFALAIDPSGAVADLNVVTLDAWLNPPAYTSEPPIFLTRPEADVTGGTPITVPEGSSFVARVQGSERMPTLDLAITELDAKAAEAAEISDEPVGFEEIGTQAFEYAQVLDQDISVAISDGRQDLGSWSFKVRPDEIPMIAFKEDPSETDQKVLKIPYSVFDDYGVVTAQARIELISESEETESETPATVDAVVQDADQSNAPLAIPGGALSEPVTVDLALPSLRTKDAEETAYQDLTAHPWAGLDVTIQLESQDEAGQWGKSEIVTFTLPEREFRDPLARAVIEQRKYLVKNPQALERAANVIAALTKFPEKYYTDMTVYLALRSVHWRLVHARESEDLEGLYDLLWDIALRLEDGDLLLAAQAVRDLQKQLMDAIADGKPQDEIDKVMQALREAMQQYMAALAQEQRESGEQRPMDPNAQMMTGSDFDDLMNAIEDMLRTGNMAGAQRLLSQLMDMLENMQFAGQGPGGMDLGNQAMNDALGQLGDMIGRQRGLLDETFRQGQQGQRQQGQNQGQPQQNRPGEPGDQDRPGQQPGQPGSPEQQQGNQDGQGQPGGDPNQQGRSPGELAQDQEGLQQELGDILQELRDQGIDVPQELERAERAMGDSGEELSEGDLPGSADSQSEAIDQLRQGAQTMAQNLLDQMLERQGMASDGSGPEDRDYDPLGRPSAAAGPEYGDSVKVPEERDLQRARDILEELRRRASELGRPTLELDYLERLLKRF